jgi:hypothetical protein
VIACWIHDLAVKRGDAEYKIVNLEDFGLPHLDETLPAAMGRCCRGALPPGPGPRPSGARHTIRAVASDTALWSDDVWVVASTPVECGRSRETAKRSELAGWAQYGYCASHSRWFWGLRLHLVCTLHGLPVAFALTGGQGGRPGRAAVSVHR